MNKKLILIIILSLFIVGMILLIISLKTEQKNSNVMFETDDKEHSDELQDNKINENYSMEENTEKNETQVIKEENIEENATNENINNNIETNTTKNTNVVIQSKTENKGNNNAEQKTNNTITINSTGSYDIKNGGTATYSDEVEIPKEWLDY